MNSPVQILFIGNSFTSRNALPEMLSKLAASADPPTHVETQQVIANGMALKTHWDRGVARDKINAEPWDFVVLQEQSTLPLKNRARMHESITRFADEITRHGSRTVLYMTWTRLNAPERQDELADAYASIGRSVGAIVAPVGLAWQSAFKKSPGIVLHDKDGSHPNQLGSYLAACVFYATLFDASPVGLAVEPSIARKFDAPTGQFLQQVAQDTVKTFLRGLTR